MEDINAFVRAAALGVPPPQAQPEDLYDILPRQGKANGGQATFATSGRRITLTAATSHFPGTRRPQATPSVSTTRSSQLPSLTTSLPRPIATTSLIPLAPVLPTTEISSSPVATTLPSTLPILSPVPNQPSPVQPSPIPSRVPSEQEQNGAQSPSSAPVTATPGGTDAGVIVGAILLVLGTSGRSKPTFQQNQLTLNPVGIAILAAVFFFIRKRVKGGGQPKTTTESFDFEPPPRTNPNLSRAETAAMAELMRIAYRVENEGDGSRDSYYPGQPPREKTRPDFPGGAGGVAPGPGFTTPYDESRQADNVARMQSLGSESVAQLGLKHPVGRWVHIQRPGAVAERTSAYNVPDMPAAPGLPDRYSTSNVYSGVAR